MRYEIYEIVNKFDTRAEAEMWVELNYDDKKTIIKREDISYEQ